MELLTVSIKYYSYQMELKVRYYLLNNSSTTKKQMAKFSSANFQKKLSPSYIILRIQRLEGSVDLDEVAHFEPPHQVIPCLQIQFFFISGTYSVNILVRTIHSQEN